ncbi:hypothetical protein [Pedobacter sp. KBW06]|uniref:hypothetical protein n=1 Tax=Pedobacter sp. KBW06 TaxID=2153359 RepID=UPI000F59DFF1|nr:hypothetical protein [Pedobacter sp. KBW06]
MEVASSTDKAGMKHAFCPCSIRVLSLFDPCSIRDLSEAVLTLPGALSFAVFWLPVTGDLSQLIITERKHTNI